MTKQVKRLLARRKNRKAYGLYRFYRQSPNQYGCGIAQGDYLMTKAFAKQFQHYDENQKEVAQEWCVQLIRDGEDLRFPQTNAEVITQEKIDKRTAPIESILNYLK